MYQIPINFLENSNVNFPHLFSIAVFLLSSSLRSRLWILDRQGAHDQVCLMFLLISLLLHFLSIAIAAYPHLFVEIPVHIISSLRTWVAYQVSTLSTMVPSPKEFIKLFLTNSARLLQLIWCPSLCECYRVIRILSLERC